MAHDDDGWREARRLKPRQPVLNGRSGAQPAKVVRIDRDRRIEAWIRRAKDGDAAAFNCLIDCHETHLLSLAVRRLTNRDDALDCCQEAMLAAWQAIKTFEGDAEGFGGWLARIVLNRCINRARQRSAREIVPLDVYDALTEVPDALLDYAASPESVANLSELERAFADTVDRLPEPHRAVACMRCSGYTYAEMADVLGVPIGTVRSRVVRARARMRRMMEEAVGAEG